VRFWTGLSLPAEQLSASQDEFCYVKLTAVYTFSKKRQGLGFHYLNAF
jgi:hypothetical protein